MQVIDNISCEVKIYVTLENLISCQGILFFKLYTLTVFFSIFYFILHMYLFFHVSYFLWSNDLPQKMIVYII